MTLLTFQKKFKINQRGYYLEQNINNIYCNETDAKEANKPTQN